VPWAQNGSKFEREGKVGGAAAGARHKASLHALERIDRHRPGGGGVGVSGTPSSLNGSGVRGKPGALSSLTDPMGGSPAGTRPI